MARLGVEGRSLHVRLNPAEKLLALRRDVTIPLSEVRSLGVVDRPWDDLIPQRVSMGFAASTAPGATIATIGPRARAGSGRALVIVYLNRPAVVIDVDPTTTGWALLIVSVRQPEQVEHVLRTGNAPG